MKMSGDFYIVFPNKKGEKWSAQTAGCACAHPEIRGDGLNLEHDDLIYKLAEQNYVCYEGKGTLTIEKIIKKYKLPLKCLSHSSKYKSKGSPEELAAEVFMSYFGGNELVSHEAWQWVRVLRNKHPQLKKYAGKEGVLMYPNSD